jgi:hypothetical protein
MEANRQIVPIPSEVPRGPYRHATITDQRFSAVARNHERGLA